MRSTSERLEKDGAVVFHDVEGRKGAVEDRERCACPGMVNFCRGWQEPDVRKDYPIPRRGIPLFRLARP